MSKARMLFIVLVTTMLVRAQVAPLVTDKGTDGVGRLKGTVRVRVEHLQDWLKTEPKPDATKLTLFLDGRPLKGVLAVPPQQGSDVLLFDLVRNDDNKVVWNALMRKPGFQPRRVEVSVGPESGPRFQSGATFTLEVIYSDLAMPDFSPTLLGLMGISSGTSLGFKIPEKRT